MRAGRLASVKAMLKREGYGVLEPGKPVLRNGVYLEWMSDPEPPLTIDALKPRQRRPSGGLGTLIALLSSRWAVKPGQIQ